MKMTGYMKTILILGAFFLFPGIRLCAQVPVYYNRTLNFLVEGQIDSAKASAALLMQQPGALTNPDCWYLNGVVQKELFKKYERADFDSKYRDSAFAAYKNSLLLDTVNARMQVTRQHLRYLALEYFNHAVEALDTVRFETSIRCYEKYRAAMLVADPTFNIKLKDIEFNLALASIYNDVYNLDKKKNISFFNKTRDTYLKVITWDSVNYTANYSLGLLYWNKGVDLMFAIDYDDSLGAVFDVQDRSVELFKQAKPFAEKAYFMAPKREETLFVLSGIYYSLNDFEKSDQYRNLRDEILRNKD